MYKNIFIKRKINLKLLLISALIIAGIIINTLIRIDYVGKFYEKNTENTTKSYEVADLNGNGIIDGGDIPFTPPVNICEQNLNNIHIEGKWESWSLDVPYWKFEFYEDKTFKFFTRTYNFTSSGKWQYIEQDRTLTILILDQLDYWKEGFFIYSESDIKLFSGIKAMNIDNYSITFNIEDYSSEDCSNVYKAINFFGWNFIKIN